MLTNGEKKKKNRKTDNPTVFVYKPFLFVSARVYNKQLAAVQNAPFRREFVAYSSSIRRLTV